MVFFLIAACGQKGPLVLPKKQFTIEKNDVFGPKKDSIPHKKN